MIVSRPKTVMNHGIPAAGMRPVRPAPRMRSEARSETDWKNERAESVPVGPELRHAQLPRGERVAHARQLLAEAPLGRARRERVAVDRGDDVQPQLPASRAGSSSSR